MFHTRQFNSKKCHHFFKNARNSFVEKAIENYWRRLVHFKNAFYFLLSSESESLSSGLLVLWNFRPCFRRSIKASNEAALHPGCNALNEGWDGKSDKKERDQIWAKRLMMLWFYSLWHKGERVPGQVLSYYDLLQFVAVSPSWPHFPFDAFLVHKSENWVILNQPSWVHRTWGVGGG